MLKWTLQETQFFNKKGGGSGPRFPTRKFLNRYFSWPYYEKKIVFFSSEDAYTLRSYHTLYSKQAHRKLASPRIFVCLVSREKFRFQELVVGNKSRFPIFYCRLMFLNFFQITYIFLQKNAYILKFTFVTLCYCIQRHQSRIYRAYVQYLF